jgi:hypothetical protein
MKTTKTRTMNLTKTEIYMHKLTGTKTKIARYAKTATN